MGVLRAVSHADERGCPAAEIAAARDVREATGGNVSIAYVDQGYTGQDAAQQAAQQGIELVVVRLDAAKKGFVLLPNRWVVERSFAWTGRFRRLARDFERLPATFAGLHWLAFFSLMLHSLVKQFRTGCSLGEAC